MMLKAAYMYNELGALNFTSLPAPFPALEKIAGA
jgi:hypothetical protein